MVQNNFYEGKLFYGTYPPEAAEWCNSSGQHFIDTAGKNEEGKIVYIIKKTPSLMKEELENLRASTYTLEVDPITCTILRKRDILPTLSEDDRLILQTEIDELVALRAEKVQEIKDRYPYPEE